MCSRMLERCSIFSIVRMCVCCFGGLAFNSKEAALLAAACETLQIFESWLDGCDKNSGLR